MSTEEIFRMFFLFLLGPMGGAMAAMLLVKFIITEPLRKLAQRAHWKLRYLLECVMCVYGWPAIFITFFYEPNFLRWLFNARWEIAGIDVMWPLNKALSCFILWYLGGVWYRFLYPFIERKAPKKRLILGPRKTGFLRKSRELHPEIYDVAIVGGGVTGTAQAYIFSRFMRGIAKVLLLEKNKDVALRIVAHMKRGRVVDLDVELSLLAAKLSLEYKLPMADSIILATAHKYEAVLWTQDGDFKKIPGVKYFSKR